MPPRRSSEKVSAVHLLITQILLAVHRPCAPGAALRNDARTRHNSLEARGKYSRLNQLSLYAYVHGRLVCKMDISLLLTALQRSAWRESQVVRRFVGVGPRRSKRLVDPRAPRLPQVCLH